MAVSVRDMHDYLSLHLDDAVFIWSQITSASAGLDSPVH